jgi:hypothetical protein
MTLEVVRVSGSKQNRKPHQYCDCALNRYE